LSSNVPQSEEDAKKFPPTPNIDSRALQTSHTGPNSILQLEEDAKPPSSTQNLNQEPFVTVLPSSQVGDQKKSESVLDKKLPDPPPPTRNLSIAITLIEEPEGQGDHSTYSDKVSKAVVIDSVMEVRSRWHISSPLLLSISPKSPIVSLVFYKSN
jgi:hypothetical protein